MASLNCRRRRWVIPELDARGEIDAHAAMCLRQALDARLEGDARTIVVDLRDLTAIDTGGLAILMRARADCQTRGSELKVLVSGRPGHGAIVDAIASAGLLDEVLLTPAPVEVPCVTKAPDIRPH